MSDRRGPFANQASRTARDWHFPTCFGCGMENPHGLHAPFPFDEERGEVRFEYLPTAFQEGPPGYVHGGVLAALMDEAQGVLCFHVGHFIMTEQLHLQYHRATPLHRPFHIHCWLTAVRSRRIYTQADLRSGEGELLVSASASWYLMNEQRLRRLFADRFPPEEAQRVQVMLEANRKRAQAIRRRLRAAATPRQRPEPQ